MFASTVPPRKPAPGRCLPGVFVLLVLTAAAGGCRKDVKDMDTVEKARLTVQLRKEADESFSRWQRSGREDLEELLSFTEKYRLTTELNPSPAQCRWCYLNYGQSLRLLGMYYWEDERRATEALDRAPAEEVAELEKRAREAREKVLEYFRKSNEILEGYVSIGEAIDPEVYDWVSQQYAELGDFRRALRYLDLLEQSMRFNERDQRKLAERRRVFVEKYRRQQLEEVRRSLGDQ